MKTVSNCCGYLSEEVASSKNVGLHVGPYTQAYTLEMSASKLFVLHTTGKLTSPSKLTVSSTSAIQSDLSSHLFYLRQSSRFHKQKLVDSGIARWLMCLLHRQSKKQDTKLDFPKY